MGGLCRGGLRLLAQRRKSSRIVDRQIGQDLAVQLDAGLLQAVDELAVADAVQLGGGADAHNPDGTVLALLLLAAAVGELQPALDRLFRLNGTVSILLSNSHLRAQVSFCGARGAWYHVLREALLLLFQFAKRLEARKLTTLALRALRGRNSLFTRC